MSIPRELKAVGLAGTTMLASSAAATPAPRPVAISVSQESERGGGCEHVGRAGAFGGQWDVGIGLAAGGSPCGRYA